MNIILTGILNKNNFKKGKAIELKKITANGESVSFNLRRSGKARRMRLQFTPLSGLELILPDFVELEEGIEFLRTKIDWIKKNCFNKVTGTHNAGSPRFLGNEIKVYSEVKTDLKKVEFIESPGALKILICRDDKRAIGELYDIWLKKKAKQYIIERAIRFANLSGIRFNKISLRNQRTRWGSCSRKGNLSFNVKLMRLEPALIDYVIIHEFCHLRVPNHSLKFWDVVEAYEPNYKELRKKLKMFF